jgi:hypothetical protein
MPKISDKNLLTALVLVATIALIIALLIVGDWVAALIIAAIGVLSVWVGRRKPRAG